MTNFSHRYTVKQNIDLGVCTTLNGIPCHLPFLYNGVWYKTCTTEDSSVPWCSTAAEYAWDSYGTCSSDCFFQAGNFQRKKHLSYHHFKCSEKSRQK